MRATQFDLTLDLTDHGTVMEGKIIYSCDLFLESTVQRMAGHYKVSMDVAIFAAAYAW